MRITIWLSIAVFVTTLYWPQLVNYSGIFSCALCIFVFLCWPKWRYLAILPFTALYFSLFSYVSLFGGSFESINYKPLLANDLLATPLVAMDLARLQSTSHASISNPEPGKHKLVNHISNIKEHKQQVSQTSSTLSRQDNTIIVRVRSLINTKNTGYFVASIVSVNEQHCDFCPLVEMRWYKPSVQVQAGQMHQFKVRLKALQGKANPNGFDRQKWRYSQHIAYIANIKEHMQVIDERISIRASLYQKVMKATSDLSQQGSLLALIFADKSLLNEHDKSLIKHLGIAHLFAISGLHIGLLFIFSTVILNAIVKQLLPVRYLGWFCWRLVNTFGLLVCLSYGYISGFSLPTERALLMLLISVLVLSSKLKISLLDLLLLCLWIILLLDPLSILSSSLWLSFMAMSTILVFIWLLQRPQQTAEQNKSWYKLKLQRLLLVFKGLLLLQLVLTLFMLPIQLINFSAISLYALPINLIAIPLFSWFIIPLTLLGVVLLLFIEPFGVALFTISDQLLSHFLHYFSTLSAGYLMLSQLHIVLILTFFLFISIFLLLNLIHRFFNISKTKIWLLPSILLLFVGIRVVEQRWQNEQQWQLEVFDVGQGLAILIYSDGHTLLYDTGPSYGGSFAVAESTVLPYLQARGIEQLDYFFISHSDNDHAGGKEVIQNHLLIKQAYAGEADLMNQTYSFQTNNNQLNRHTEYQQCISGQVHQLGKLTLTTLSPLSVGNNNNNNSCVLQVSDGVNRVLLTGDISKAVEQKLIVENRQSMIEKNVDNLHADILIAPHHGSNTSSSLAFIKQVNPQWVVFSAGYKNRWRFPVEQVVQRYQQLGIKHLTTANTGFIRFNVQNHHIEVKTYREDLAAYWYHRHLAL